MQNPFNPFQPAEGPLFANRKQEQAWFQRDLIPSLAPDSLGTYNAAILGPWGIGKSSLVRQLRYLITQALSVPVPMVFISCTTGFQTLMGMCAAIANAVRQEAVRLARWDQVLEAELRQWEFEIRLPGVRASRPRASDPEASISAAELLRARLLYLWERGLRDYGYGVVIVLDDVNLLQAVDPQALMLLRAVFQDLHMYQARYALVVTGPLELFSEVRDVAEPVTRFFEHLPLTNFSLADMPDAVREPILAVHAPLAVDDEAIDWLWRRTQGHPYFVTYVMHYAFQWAMENQREVLTAPDLQALWPGVLARLDRGKFRDDWNAATPSEQRTLLVVAQGRTDQANRGLLTRLVKKGLVARTGRGQYDLYHPMFRDYVLRAAGMGGAQSGREGSP